MPGSYIANHQVLTWAAHNDGASRQDVVYGLRNLEPVLSGSMRDKTNVASAIFYDLVEFGALSFEDEILRKGARFHEAMAAYAPRRVALAADDLVPWRRGDGFGMPRGGALGEHPWSRAIVGECLCRQREGRLNRIDMAAGRCHFADDWNTFVATGQMTIQITRVLMEHIREAGMMADMGREKEEQQLATYLNEAISTGFPAEMASFAGVSVRAYDCATGDELAACLIGWNMILHTCRVEDDYDLKPLDLGARIPDVIHMEISTEEDLSIMSSRGVDDPIRSALYAAHVSEMETCDNLNSDTGVPNPLPDRGYEPELGGLFPSPYYREGDRSHHHRELR